MAALFNQLLILIKIIKCFGILGGVLGLKANPQWALRIIPLYRMSDSDCKGSPPPVTGRHEKSLGLLTSKFVELLQSSKGGILDLKKVSLLMEPFDYNYGTRYMYYIYN